MGTTTSSRSVIPQAPDSYDVSDQQRMRTTIEQRLEDLERSIYGLNTTYGTISIGSEDITLVNNANNNVYPGYATFARIVGPNGVFSITGIEQGELGRLLLIRNTVNFAMTISNESASSEAKNRIFTQTGADLVTTAHGSVILSYDPKQDAEGRWIVIAAQL